MKRDPISAARRMLGASVIVAALMSAGAADAALTTPKCLAKKVGAWGKLRSCQRGAHVKEIQAKPFDALKCEVTFQKALAKLDEQATKAAIGCRYRDGGDGTVTDYDTGLQWEKKTGFVANAQSAGFCVANDLHCVNTRHTWFKAGELANIFNGTTTDGSLVLLDIFAGHSDWRLPTIVELRSIVDVSVPGCGSGTPACIAPIFGPTYPSSYWSGSVINTNQVAATEFLSGTLVLPIFKAGDTLARVVRTAF